MGINFLVLVSLFFYGCDERVFYFYSAHRFDFINFWFIVALVVCVYGIIVFVNWLVKKIPQWKEDYIELSKKQKSMVEEYRQYLVKCDNNSKVALNYKQWVFAYKDKNTHKHVFIKNKRSIYVFCIWLVAFVCGCSIIKYNMDKYDYLSLSFEVCLSHNRMQNYLGGGNWDDINPLHVKLCDNVAEESWKIYIRDNKSWINTVFD